MVVVVVEADLSVRDERVPVDGADQREALRRLASAGRPGSELAWPASYHRQVATWVHTVDHWMEDAGQWEQVLCRPNVLATALVSAWLGRDLGPGYYWLYGPVVFSGPLNEQVGTGVSGLRHPAGAGSLVSGLGPDRVREIWMAQAAYVSVLRGWERSGAPADEAEQWRQVVAAVRDVVPETERG